MNRIKRNLNILDILIESNENIKNMAFSSKYGNDEDQTIREVEQEDDSKLFDDSHNVEKDKHLIQKEIKFAEEDEVANNEDSLRQDKSGIDSI